MYQKVSSKMENVCFSKATTTTFSVLMWNALYKNRHYHKIVLSKSFL